MTPRKNPKVDTFLRKTKTWHDEIVALREIALGCGLTEELKWAKPCYTHDGRNVVILIPLKESVALAFTQGALLKDPKGILTKMGENTQAARWIKFTAVSEITKRTAVLKTYIRQAIAAEKAGLKVKLKSTADYPVPDELKAKFAADPAFKAAFAALTPGRQRAYLLFFASAKQSKTREARIEKSIPDIFAGKGWNER